MRHGSSGAVLYNDGYRGGELSRYSLFDDRLPQLHRHQIAWSCWSTQFVACMQNLSVNANARRPIPHTALDVACNRKLSDSESLLLQQGLRQLRLTFLKVQDCVIVHISCDFNLHCSQQTHGSVISIRQCRQLSGHTVQTSHDGHAVCLATKRSQCLFDCARSCAKMNVPFVSAVWEMGVSIFTYCRVIIRNESCVVTTYEWPDMPSSGQISDTLKCQVVHSEKSCIVGCWILSGGHGAVQMFELNQLMFMSAFAHWHDVQAAGDFHTGTHTHTHTHTHTQWHCHTHSYIHTYIHTYTHTHTRPHLWGDTMQIHTPSRVTQFNVQKKFEGNLPKWKTITLCDLIHDKHTTT